MENTEQYFQEPEENLKITGLAEINLSGAVKWAKIVSVIYFSLMGLAVAGLLLMICSSIFGVLKSTEVLVLFLYVPILMITTLPYVFLYKFSKQVKDALLTRESSYLTDGFGSLKRSFLIAGIFMILAIVFYATLLLVVVAVAI